MSLGIRQTIEIASVVINWYGFVVGVLGGILLVLLVFFCSPALYRLRRRRSLRQQWRLDRPNEVPSGIMSPVWQEYDPEEVTVDSRCVCHGRRLLTGEKVMLWPEIGPFNTVYTAVYCEKVKEPA